MMTYKNYLFSLGGLTLLSLLSVGLINYYIDPANVYHKKVMLDKTNSASAYAFVAQLQSSKNGLLWPNNSWNMRDIKSALAKSKIKIDCAVMGSSHVMQISSVREHSSLTGLCGTMINLGISGGTIEDYLAMSFMLLNKNKIPKTIIFGIDPWTLGFRRDNRWERYKDSYLSMKKVLLFSPETDTNSKSESTRKLLNLINPSYFVRSITQIDKPGYKIKHAPFFKIDQGVDDPVILPDGSLVYSKEYILKSAASKIPIGGSVYKIKKGSQISERAITLFEKLLIKLNEDGVKSVILMTPYHHNVWADTKSKTVKALMEVEPKLRTLGEKLGITVLGSFNPKKIRCNADEFYDFMHAKDSCLAKIGQ